ANSGEAVSIGDITMKGVEEDEDGGYYVEEASFPNVSATSEGATFTATDLTLSGISIPADPKGEGLDSMLLYENAHSGPVKVVQNGEELFSLAESNLNLTLREDESGFVF